MDAEWQVPQTFWTVSLPGASGRSRGAPALGGGEGGLFCAFTGAAPNAASSSPAVQNHSAEITSLVFHTPLQIPRPILKPENLLGTAASSAQVYGTDACDVQSDY